MNNIENRTTGTKGIRARYLEKIKDKLEAVLPSFIFSLILKIFRKIKSIVKSVLPVNIRKMVFKIKQRIICEFISYKNRNFKTEKLADFYQKDYHLDKYINNPVEVELKKWQAIAIQRALPDLKEVLVAGCSGGELVRAFRHIGIDAYGFDISSDLDEIVIDEVRKYIKKGNILDIPFEEFDNFDGLIAVDVFEHLPMNQIDKMVKEIAKTKVRYMITLINYFDYQYIEHLTLKPLSWWQKKFRNYYWVDENIKFSNSDMPALYSLNDDPIHRFVFWRRVC